MQQLEALMMGICVFLFYFLERFFCVKIICHVLFWIHRNYLYIWVEVVRWGNTAPVETQKKNNFCRTVSLNDLFSFDFESKKVSCAGMCTWLCVCCPVCVCVLYYSSWQKTDKQGVVLSYRYLQVCLSMSHGSVSCGKIKCSGCVSICWCLQLFGTCTLTEVAG